jgi:hypothetical protein
LQPNFGGMVRRTTAEKRLRLNAERTIKQNKAAAAILKDYLFQKKM